jgi:hypothetical protein
MKTSVDNTVRLLNTNLEQNGIRIQIVNLISKQHLTVIENVRADRSDWTMSWARAYLTK